MAATCGHPARRPGIARKILARQLRHSLGQQPQSRARAGPGAAADRRRAAAPCCSPPVECAPRVGETPNTKAISRAFAGMWRLKSTTECTVMHATADERADVPGRRVAAPRSPRRRAATDGGTRASPTARCAPRNSRNSRCPHRAVFGQEFQVIVVRTDRIALHAHVAEPPSVIKKRRRAGAEGGANLEILARPRPTSMGRASLRSKRPFARPWSSGLLRRATPRPLAATAMSTRTTRIARGSIPGLVWRRRSSPRTVRTNNPADALRKPPRLAVMINPARQQRDSNRTGA